MYIISLRWYCWYSINSRFGAWNGMNLSKEWPDVAQKWWVDWQVAGESVSSIRDTGFCRRGDGCLDTGHQSPSFSLSFFLYVPPRQLEEVAGPLCPTLGSVPFLFFLHIVDESIRHRAAFCPLFAATLSKYHRPQQELNGKKHFPQHANIIHSSLYCLIVLYELFHQ